ncbi:Hypothetical predicted protein [Mytilus galloprovincialis]|uniref:Uncharacterized protein n=1 Tax=Mytilus galloprovincialis TaxID=29158 RepID=A0A8B6CXX5_MYTGA|nr:Hypothetical predicted protein [Mytilus galloprovincialis]
MLKESYDNEGDPDTTTSFSYGDLERPLESFDLILHRDLDRNPADYYTHPFDQNREAYQAYEYPRRYSPTDYHTRDGHLSRRNQYDSYSFEHSKQIQERDQHQSHYDRDRYDVRDCQDDRDRYNVRDRQDDRDRYDVRGRQDDRDLYDVRDRQDDRDRYDVRDRQDDRIQLNEKKSGITSYRKDDKARDRSPDRHLSRSSNSRDERSRYRDRSRERRRSRDDFDRYGHTDSRRKRSRSSDRDRVRDKYRDRKESRDGDRLRDKYRDRKESRDRYRSHEKYINLEKKSDDEKSLLSSRKKDAFDLIALVKKVKNDDASSTDKTVESALKTETCIETTAHETKIKLNVKKISMTLKKPDNKPINPGEKVSDMFADENSDEEDKTQRIDSVPHVKYNMPMPKDLDKAIFKY